MQFSIVIPTFRRAELLGDAVRSALEQSYANREVIVVDDGSGDETESVVRGFGSAVRYLQQENRGKATALNLGISVSKGDAIIVLDDDDVFPVWALARHAAALAANPAATFSYGRYRRFQGKAPPQPRQLEDGAPVPDGDPRRLLVKLMENCFIPNPGWAVRRSAQLNAGLYDASLARSQDYDMLLRVARQNEGAFVDDVVFYQRKHEGYRGPLHDQTLAVDTTDKWIKYDAVIFRRLDEEWELGDFQPFGRPLAEPFDRALALLQKGVVLFRRKVYDVAAGVLADYRTLLGQRSPSPIELKIATGLLGSRYGIDDLLALGALDNDAIGQLRRADWPLSMRVALGSQLRWRVRAAIKTRDMSAALRLLRFSQRAFGLDATASLGFRTGASLGHWADVRARPQYAALEAV